MRYKLRKTRNSSRAAAEDVNNNVNGSGAEDDPQTDVVIEVKSAAKKRQKTASPLKDIHSNIEDKCVEEEAPKPDIPSETEDKRISDEKQEADIPPKADIPLVMGKELSERIAENDAYFSSLIDLIPAKIYFGSNDEMLDSMQKQKRKAFGDDLDLSSKSKLKRFKLDPNSGQKVSEIANNFYNKSKLNANNKQNDSMDNKMAELKKKLNQKISNLKSKRGEKSRAKSLRESKKQRKRENSMRASKQKGFAKRQLTTTREDSPDSGVVVSQPTPKHHKKRDESSPKTPKNMPKIYNKEGNIVYSKFDLISPSTAGPPEQNKRHKQKKNNLNKLLAKTKRDEQKLSELAATDPSKAKEVKDKKLWRKAIDLSEGVKVKDKPKLIEKAINRKKKLKQKSAKQWEERKESVEKSKKSRDDKRQRNIDKRKQNKKAKKLKHLKKKGRLPDTTK